MTGRTTRTEQHEERLDHMKARLDRMESKSPTARASADSGGGCLSVVLLLLVIAMTSIAREWFCLQRCGPDYEVVEGCIEDECQCVEVAP